MSAAAVTNLPNADWRKNISLDRASVSSAMLTSKMSDDDRDWIRAQMSDTTKIGRNTMVRFRNSDKLRELLGVRTETDPPATEKTGGY